MKKKMTVQMITLAIALMIVSWISYGSLVGLSSENPKRIQSSTADDVIVSTAPVTVTPVPEPTIETKTIDPVQDEVPKQVRKPAKPKAKPSSKPVNQEVTERMVTELLKRVEAEDTGYGLVMPTMPVPMPSPPPVMVMAPPVMASPPATPPRVVATYISPHSESKVLPYRELIRLVDINKESEDLMSFVLFVNRPVDSATKNRYIDVCKYWEATLSPLSSQDKVELANEGVRTTPMYWLTKDYMGERNCDNLYAYDFDAAAKLAIPLQSDLANSAGPFLVLMRNKVHQHLVLDISKFSPPDIQRAFDTWRSQVCKEDPMSGAKIAKFREYFRALVQDYGESILKVMEGG